MHLQTWLPWISVLWRSANHNPSLSYAQHSHPYTELPERGHWFNRTSFIIYNTQFRRPILRLLLTVTFRSQESSGMLLFASRQREGNGSFILLQMRGQSLEFGIDTNGDNSTILKWVPTGYCKVHNSIIVSLYTPNPVFVQDTSPDTEQVAHNTSYIQQLHWKLTAGGGWTASCHGKNSQCLKFLIIATHSVPCEIILCP